MTSLSEELLKEATSQLLNTPQSRCGLLLIEGSPTKLYGIVSPLIVRNQQDTATMGLISLVAESLSLDLLPFQAELLRMMFGSTPCIQLRTNTWLYLPMDAPLSKPVPCFQIR
ncbi:MAG TPA: hypothetical protein [Caudoviricetes sp.]|nr:MAG TPA: hypothetical protein [Caudoviricetes sp.]